MAEEDDNTIFGGDEENTDQQQNQEMSLNEITSGSGNVDYIDTEALEEGVTYEVQRVEKNYGDDPKFHLSNSDYNVRVYTTDGRVQTIGAWSMFNLFSQAAREAQNEGLESTTGLHLNVSKEGRGQYAVSWSLDGEEWNEVEVEDE